MYWQVQFLPQCTHHVFLSHCREDRDWLVRPLNAALQSKAITTWLDLHDYPYGRTSLGGLRDGVLKSRHTVFLVTQAMLTQPRGWTVVELAWTHLLQENLCEAGGEMQTVALPLFFVERGSESLLRSAWQAVRDRGAFHTPADGDPVAWATRQIIAFLLRQEERGLDNARWLAEDSQAQTRLDSRQGLIDRLTARHPISFPSA
jgi:hypothetical protein